MRSVSQLSAGKWLLAAWIGLALTSLASLAQEPAPGAAQPAAGQPPAARQPIRRLPNYFARVVTPDQRTKIYGIQDQYEPRLEALRAQMRELVAQRDAEIETVLTAEQKAQIEKLRAEARARANPPAAQPAAPAAPASDE